MNITKINQTQLEPTAKEAIRNAVRGNYYTIVEKPIVFVHTEKQIEKQDVFSNGYDLCEGLYNGGTLVSNKGDFVYIGFNDSDNGFIQKFSNSLVEWLKSKGLNATCEKNDILVDGYKICGTVVTRYGYVDFSGAFIGVNTKLEDIQKLCKKHMVKVPKGLSDFGITSEEVEQWFLDFIKINRR